MLAGKELDENLTIEKCEVPPNSNTMMVLLLKLEEGAGNFVFVKTPTGRTLTLDFTGEETIGEL
jgi:hypothetical protein